MRSFAHFLRLMLASALSPSSTPAPVHTVPASPKAVLWF